MNKKLKKSLLIAFITLAMGGISNSADASDNAKEVIISSDKIGVMNKDTIDYLLQTDCKDIIFTEDLKFDEDACQYLDNLFEEEQDIELLNSDNIKITLHVGDEKNIIVKLKPDSPLLKSKGFFICDSVKNCFKSLDPICEYPTYGDETYVPSPKSEKYISASDLYCSDRLVDENGVEYNSTEEFFDSFNTIALPTNLSDISSLTIEHYKNLELIIIPEEFDLSVLSDAFCDEILKRKGLQINYNGFNYSASYFVSYILRKKTKNITEHQIDEFGEYEILDKQIVEPKFEDVNLDKKSSRKFSLVNTANYKSKKDILDLLKGQGETIYFKPNTEFSEGACEYLRKLFFEKNKEIIKDDDNGYVEITLYDIDGNNILLALNENSPLFTHECFFDLKNVIFTENDFERGNLFINKRTDTYLNDIDKNEYDSIKEFRDEVDTITLPANFDSISGFNIKRYEKLNCIIIPDDYDLKKLNDKFLVEILEMNRDLTEACNDIFNIVYRGETFDAEDFVERIMKKQIIYFDEKIKVYDNKDIPVDYPKSVDPLEAIARNLNDADLRNFALMNKKSMRVVKNLKTMHKPVTKVEDSLLLPKIEDIIYFDDFEVFSKYDLSKMNKICILKTAFEKLDKQKRLLYCNHIVSIFNVASAFRVLSFNDFQPEDIDGFKSKDIDGSKPEDESYDIILCSGQIYLTLELNLSLINEDDLRGIFGNIDRVAVSSYGNSKVAKSFSKFLLERK